MTRYAIDAPTLLRLVGADTPPAASHQLVAPAVLRSQALQLLLDRVRAGELTDADALRVHERITTLKIRVLGDRVSRRVAFQLAREHGWPTIGAAEYLAVARLQADALVAADPDLVARAEGLVPLAPFADLLEG